MSPKPARLRFLIGAVALALAGLVIGENVWRMLQPPPPVARGPWEPEFRIRQPAPDFELPDAVGRKQRLHSLVSGATIVIFTGDTPQSVKLLRYAEVLRRRMAPQPVTFITVATFPPGREPAFRKTTGLKQLILYERAGGPVATLYRANPGPRLFSLDRDGGVRSTGISPAEASIVSIANTLALDLGFQSPASTDARYRAPATAGLDGRTPAVEASP